MRRAAILATAMPSASWACARRRPPAAKKGAGKLRTAAATDPAGGAFDVATATADLPEGTERVGRRLHDDGARAWGATG